MTATDLSATLAACVVAGCLACPASAELLAPNGAAPVFDDWTRGDANSTYAEWDVFTDAVGGTNSPDVGESGLTGATVAQDSGVLAIVTSTGNIYSFAGATSFDVDLPGYGLGAGANTRVAVQIGALGSSLDDQSLSLTYNDGDGDVTAPPTALYDRGDQPAGDFSRSEWLAVWDIEGFNPDSALVEFSASASSMSLDTLAVDTYAQSGAFSALPAAIPEPSALALAACGMLAPVALRQRVTDARLS